jgi:hypothetical protein
MTRRPHKPKSPGKTTKKTQDRSGTDTIPHYFNSSGEVGVEATTTTTTQQAAWMEDEVYAVLPEEQTTQAETREGVPEPPQAPRRTTARTNAPSLGTTTVVPPATQPAPVGAPPSSGARPLAQPPTPPPTARVPVPAPPSSGARPLAQPPTPPPTARVPVPAPNLSKYR